MALRHRKHQESNKLRGVDRVDDEADIELGAFEELANWIPADVYAFKKKRGVTALNPCGLAGLTTEAGDPITSEAGVFIITEFSTLCAFFISTENDLVITTEAGDPIEVES